jgi:hypothetical protein
MSRRVALATPENARAAVTAAGRSGRAKAFASRTALNLADPLSRFAFS